MGLPASSTPGDLSPRQWPRRKRIVPPNGVPVRLVETAALNSPVAALLPAGQFAGNWLRFYPR